MPPLLSAWCGGQRPAVEVDLRGGVYRKERPGVAECGDGGAAWLAVGLRLLLRRQGGVLSVCGVGLEPWGQSLGGRDALGGAGGVVGGGGG